jgi:hypothetical protein
MTARPFPPDRPAASPDAAGRRGSSEDDLPLRLNHAQDRGVGRGLNPAPDEHGPAALCEYDRAVADDNRGRKLGVRGVLQLL